MPYSNDESKILVFSKVLKTYGDLKAVDNVSFEGERDKILGLIGPNGAGKTTIIKLIAGLISPDKGKILVSGISPRQAIKNGIIAFCLDSPALYKNLTVKNNLDFFVTIYPRKNKILVDFLIKEFQIKDILNKKAEKLSKGQMQKVALVRTLSSDADFYVLDEPFNALDFETRMIFVDVIEKLKNSFKKGFLITSHNISYIERLCDKVIFIDKGKVSYFGSVANLNKKLIFKIILEGDLLKAVNYFNRANDFELIKKGKDYLLISGTYQNIIKISEKINSSFEDSGFLLLNIIPIAGGLEAFFVSKLSR